MGPSTGSFAEQLLCKLAAALLFAIMLAMATNASLVQGLRFTSAIFLLTSSWHFGVAFVRRRPSSGPSEWGEAAIFSLIKPVRHRLTAHYPWCRPAEILSSVRQRQQ